jgi:hypothetical protein
MEAATCVAEAVCAILFQEQRTVEVDETGLCGEQYRWRHRQRCGDHTADHEV